MTTMTFCVPASIAMTLDSPSDECEMHLSPIKEDGSVDVRVEGDLPALRATATRIRVALAK
jgi:hypothetical protein